jgi:hypothetical protein
MRVRTIAAVLGVVAALGMTGCSAGGGPARKAAGVASAQVSPVLPDYKGRTLDVVYKERDGATPSYTTVFRSMTDGHAFDGESYSGGWIICTQAENPRARTVEFGLLPPQVPCPADGRVTSWPTVPNVVGKTGNEAKRIAEKMGFNDMEGKPLIGANQGEDQHLERVVCRQDPAAGESMRTHYGSMFMVDFVVPSGCGE